MMTDGDRFDLAQLVRDVREATGLADPGELWPQVLQKLAPADYEGALRETLPDYVRHVIKSAAPASDEREDDKDEESSNSTKTRANSNHRSSGSGSSSTSGESRRRASSGLLASSRFDGDQWRVLGECDVPFLRRAAAYLHRLAAFNVVAAERYSIVADELEARGLTYVHELDEDLVRQLLRSQP
jgi:hypothetical protein